nr:hypothetical protein [Kibdelosporangium sp. MJ126-NF4]CEL19279.1 hypothetical protein [Kibdelosporangium sp. MJ126-NF4]CTQ94922.1 hypothetical protein [Kibdelosporangium sp. MJ126-NF4]
MLTRPDLAIIVVFLVPVTFFIKTESSIWTASGHDYSFDNGRRWAVLVDDEMIEGHLFFHLGDDSSFRAKPFIGQ